MDLVALVVACGISAQSPIFVTLGAQPDCAAPTLTGDSTAFVGDELVDRWATEISAAGHRFAVPAPWIRAVMRAESGGVPSVTSPAGAMGLMQIMPATWAGLCRRYGLGADPYEPHDNVLAGVAYMRELLDRYGSPGFLAAYNAGPERLDDHRLTGRPLPDETRRYLAVVSPQLVADRSFHTPMSPTWPILAEIRASDLTVQKPIEPPSASALFVQPANASAAAGMRSASHDGAADLFGDSARDGLFATLRAGRSGL
jgi:Transglycosylase SLT domain